MISENENPFGVFYFFSACHFPQSELEVGIERRNWIEISKASPPMIPTYTQTLISFNLLDLRSPHQTKSCFHVSDDGKKSGFDNL